MKPAILFRAGAATDDDELSAAAQHFEVVVTRRAIPEGRLVIPRYAALPFYAELEAEVHAAGSALINTYGQHQYVADIRRWAITNDRGEPCIAHLTPRTWDFAATGWREASADVAFVVKGLTNSRKGEWSTRMFAPTKHDVARRAEALMLDALIDQQGIVVREYVPLRRFAEGPNGIPITNEWRFFCLGTTIIDAGFYWQSAPEHEWHGVDADARRDGEPPAPRQATELVQRVLATLSGHVPFLVVDVAERASGGWLVIELNDAQQAGLSMIPAARFYRRLAAVAALAP